MKKYFFPYIIAFSALILAGTAAFFSVTGLSKLFAGSAMAIIIMGSALEFAKIVTATFIHRYWKSLKLGMKVYLTAGVLTVMMITSAGIYGFLSNAYAITSGKLGTVQTQVDNLNNKKQIIQNEINALEESKKLKTNRIQSLTNLRGEQEKIMDSLYNRRQSVSAKRMQTEIEKSGTDIDKMNIQSDTIDNQIQRKYVESSEIDLETGNLKNNDVSGEVGPLKYIATLTGKSMDSVANFFILLLIFVFDPLAVTLVIATNIAFEKIDEPDIKKSEELKISEKKGLWKLLKNKFKKNKIGVPNNLHDKLEQNVPTVSFMSPEENIKETELPNTIQYISDESGNFAPVNKIEKNDIVSSEQNKEEVQQLFTKYNLNHSKNYLNFLEILYNSGSKNIGDTLPESSKFGTALKASEIDFIPKELDDFFVICDLYNIINMKAIPRIINKSFEEAKSIFLKF